MAEFVEREVNGNLEEVALLCSYYAFVIGRELLPDDGEENDVRWDKCFHYAMEFVCSEEYHDLTRSAYEVLQDWWGDNYGSLCS